MAHALVLYRATQRADAALRRLAQAAHERGGRITVLALAPQEPESTRCCDTRSILWNRVCRELAQDNLARALLAIDAEDEAVELATLLVSRRHPADAVTREAAIRGANEIILLDPRSSGLGALERRRLRRRSPVPVSA